MHEMNVRCTNDVQTKNCRRFAKKCRRCVQKKRRFGVFVEDAKIWCCVGSANEDQRRSTKKPVGERVSSADVRWGETCAVRVTYVGITRRCFANNCRCCVRRNEVLVFSSKMQEKRRPLRSRRAQRMCSGTEGDVRRARRPDLFAKVVRAGEGYPKRED